MNKLTHLTDRAMSMASHAGSGLKHAVVPNAQKLLQTGAALGAAKTGLKVARGFIRRNPAVAVAAAAGAGLLAYAVYRKRKKDQQHAPIEGDARRIETRKGNGAARRSAARSRRTASAEATE
ncbi:hypothetical protein [Pseudoxanthomonas mexicana]|uniref:hypothetical protein n=1 Tax=Pseudoxanthomonas mexicana TaxID=128785 RepID=UPI00398B6227